MLNQDNVVNQENIYFMKKYLLAWEVKGYKDHDCIFI